MHSLCLRREDFFFHYRNFENGKFVKASEQVFWVMPMQNKYQPIVCEECQYVVK